MTTRDRMVRRNQEDQRWADAVNGQTHGAPAGTTTDIGALMLRRKEQDLAVADSVRIAFDGAGVRISHVSVVNRRVALGEVTVEDADHLAVLLGALSPYGSGHADLDQWPTAKGVLVQLEEAVKSVTGEPLDAEFRPRCRNCESRAMVRMGGLSINAAERLLRALELKAGQ